MSDHAAHTTRYIGCEDCVAAYVSERDQHDQVVARQRLTGIQKHDLEAVRKRVTIEDGVFAYFAAVERMSKGTVT